MSQRTYYAEKSAEDVVTEAGYSGIKCEFHDFHDVEHACLLQNVCIDITRNLQYLPERLVVGYLDDPAAGVNNSQHHLLRNRKLYLPGSPTKNTWVSESAVDGKLSHVVMHSLKKVNVSSVKIREGGPSPGQLPPRVVHIRHPIVIVDAMDTINAANYGHAYMDYIFSVYVGALKVNRSISEFSFLPLHLHSGGTTDANLKKFESFLKLVNSSLHVKWGQYGKDTTLCFSELLVSGYHGLYRDSTEAVAKHSQGLRDLVYSLHPASFSSPGQSPSPSIVFAYKAKLPTNLKKFTYNGRTLLNKGEVNASLTSWFGHSRFTMVEMGDLSISRQVTLLRDAQVFISPLGGSSVAAMLLPDHAVFLQIDSYNFASHRSECLIVYECRLYSSMPHINVMRHTIAAEEMTNILAASAFKPPNRGLYSKLMGNYKLNSSRLIQSVEKALVNRANELGTAGDVELQATEPYSPQQRSLTLFSRLIRQRNTSGISHGRYDFMDGNFVSLVAILIILMTCRKYTVSRQRAAYCNILKESPT
mmetsp:Transcript_20937/g.38998  ORF Transcript_20937/g.38998 Transcript_20937/m.38998 type:complete len:532 (-) Transcript_20937:3727-5322(-)